MEYSSLQMQVRLDLWSRPSDLQSYSLPSGLRVTIFNLRLVGLLLSSTRLRTHYIRAYLTVFGKVEDLHLTCSDLNL